jgi:cellulose biosynthesis protein BcsQ
VRDFSAKNLIMKIISVFNNKGGVGKSTLAYHIGYTLSEMGHKTLFIDLDPQCNLTVFAIQEEELHRIWQEEDSYIDDFETAWTDDSTDIVDTPRSIHFLLKPAEDGVTELSKFPPTIQLNENLDLIPGRLSIHKYENTLAERWNGVYKSDNLAIRTITNIRQICTQYAALKGYEYVIIDTSPSLGILNKVIISTVDGFLIPVQPDMFSLYGIKNIGDSLQLWDKDFKTIYTLISETKREKFPSHFVRFIGYTIYNAKKYSQTPPDNEYGLAKAHYQYVNQIADTIIKCINPENRIKISDAEIKKTIGGNSIIHTHNSFPATAQALHCPMWLIPTVWSGLDHDKKEFFKSNGFEHNQGHNTKLREIKTAYETYVKDLIIRMNHI